MSSSEDETGVELIIIIIIILILLLWSKRNSEGVRYFEQMWIWSMIDIWIEPATWVHRTPRQSRWRIYLSCVPVDDDDDDD